MEITLSISKEDVMQEIAVTTAYTGATTTLKGFGKKAGPTSAKSLSAL